MRKQRIEVATCLAGVLALFLVVELQACTSIVVGRLASADGSVMTSHTCDSHNGSPEIFIVPPAKHAAGEKVVLTRRQPDNRGPMKRCSRKPTGSIPQVAETFGYIAAEYGIMNDQQLAIGESTFEGRKELQSDKGLIDCDTLTRLMLERANTARERDPRRRRAYREIRLLRRGRSAHAGRHAGSLGAGDCRTGQRGRRRDLGRPARAGRPSLDRRQWLADRSDRFVEARFLHGVEKHLYCGGKARLLESKGRRAVPFLRGVQSGEPHRVRHHPPEWEVVVFQIPFR